MCIFGHQNIISALLQKIVSQIRILGYIWAEKIINIAKWFNLLMTASTTILNTGTLENTVLNYYIPEC